MTTSFWAACGSAVLAVVSGLLTLLFREKAKTAHETANTAIETAKTAQAKTEATAQELKSIAADASVAIQTAQAAKKAAEDAGTIERAVNAMTPAQLEAASNEFK